MPTFNNFSREAASATFFALSALRDPLITGDEIVEASKNGLKAPPIALYVLPASLSIILLIFSGSLLLKDASRPRRLLPVRWVHVGHSSGKKALIGGEHVWLWGALAGASLHLAKIIWELRFKRLSIGILVIHFFSDAAFFSLFSSALFYIMSSLHSVPLLLPTVSTGYFPPTHLSQAIAPPLLSNALIVALPPLLLLALLVSQAATSGQLFKLENVVRSQSQAFLNATLPSNVSSGATLQGVWNGHALTRGSNQTMLSTGDYSSMVEQLSKVWGGVASVTEREDAVKAVGAGLILLVLLFVECRVWWRYCALVLNAEAEEAQSHAATSTAMSRSSSSASSFSHFSYRDEELDAGLYIGLEYVPLPPAPSLCRTDSNISSNSSYTSHSYEISTPLFRSASSPLSTLSRASYNIPRPQSSLSRHSSYSYSHSQPSYATPSVSSPTANWPDDLPLMCYHVDEEVMMPASAFLVTKGGPKKEPMKGLVESVTGQGDSDQVLPLFFERRWGMRSGMGIGLGSDSASFNHDKLKRCESTGSSVSWLSLARSRWESVYSEDSDSEWDLDMMEDLVPRSPAPREKKVDNLKLEGFSSSWERQKSCDTLPFYQAEVLNYSFPRGQSEICSRTVTQSGRGLRDKMGDLELSRAMACDIGRPRDDAVSLVLDRSYTGPSSDCLRVMQHVRGRDALGLLGLLMAYGGLLLAKALFGKTVGASLLLGTVVSLLDSLLPIFGALVTLTFSLCRSNSAKIDKDMYMNTRWGRNLDRKGWWIPNQNQI